MHFFVCSFFSFFRLNDTVMDGCRWSAKLKCGDNTSTATNVTDDAQLKAGSQFTSKLLDIKKQLDMKQIYLTDLENLHRALVHLQDTAAAC